jgi:hypothetical protein
LSILIDKSTRLVVQGITGREGTFHTRQCMAYGTKVVAGVTPGKGGITHEGVPVFNTVVEAVDKEGANASVIFVPSAYAADTIMEAASAGVALIVCITDCFSAIAYAGSSGPFPRMITMCRIRRVGFKPNFTFAHWNVSETLAGFPLGYVRR